MNLVTRLRGDEIDSIKSEVSLGRRDHILKSLDERGGAQELVRQQYSGRYPFELLQNANDAAVESGRVGRVRFVLSETALLVADNGSGFHEEQVRAICGLGRSSKDPRKSVGYKGLGFKSVGEITSRPQILSIGESFEFDDDRVRASVADVAGVLLKKQRLPVYAFPFAIDATSLGPDQKIAEAALEEGYSTVLRLPLSQGVSRSDVEQHLTDTLLPKLLLFLAGVDELELRGTSSDFVAVATRDTGPHADEVLLESNGRLENWLVFRRGCAVDRTLVDPLGDSWADIEMVHVAVAVELSEARLPLSTRTHPLHVYFPTEEATSLPLIIQGDFALQLDRRQLASNPEAVPYNSWLLDQVAAHLGDVVAPALAGLFPGAASVVAAMTPHASGTGWGADCLRRCIAALRGSRSYRQSTGIRACQLRR